MPQYEYPICVVELSLNPSLFPVVFPYMCACLVVPSKVISELATHALGNLPAVFILDNVHLMDKMSWKLLIQVHDDFARLHKLTSEHVTTARYVSVGCSVCICTFGFPFVILCLSPTCD